MLAVRVHQWSAGSYLEDQGMWWLSGIFRPVALLARPPGAMVDHQVHADYEHVTGRGTLRVDVDCAAPVRLRAPELGIDCAAGEQIQVPAEPWSAESPRLYDASSWLSGAPRSTMTGPSRVSPARSPGGISACTGCSTGWTGSSMAAS